MIRRGQNFKSVPLNIVGSSSFGRYPKISNERTYNMFTSDGFLIPYAGYEIAIPAAQLGTIGRAIHTSTKLGRIVAVYDNKVYLINLFYDHSTEMAFDQSIVQIGTLNTNQGIVYITENNKPQIALSDGVSIYIYDPTLTPVFQEAPINFIPGYIDFHDTYFLNAASEDQTYFPPANNTWRLSGQNNGLSWPTVAQNIGLLQTKPDNTQAVVRFPSKGNMIIVMGTTVTEFWFDTGAQLFPYQRNNQATIDYGCLSPATIAATDELVVWLAINEKSGPIIMYTTGGMPEKITTDGIDYLFSQLTDPADSRAFLYRQDGHLFYQINFYTDNLSLFYDFNTQKFFHTTDENLNHSIIDQVAFFNNQYYFITKNNGNLYALDTIFETYAGAEIPRIRTCQNIRLPSQEYFIVNDIGFTIESGETNYQIEQGDPIYWLTEDGQFLIITEGSAIFLLTEDGNYLADELGNDLLSEQSDSIYFNYLIFGNEVLYITPRVDLSISIDGGASFSSDMPYVLPGVGQRKNRLMWWQCGIANDFVPQFKFWSIGRAVCTDGVVNIRQ